jgi:CubicO group peptidase (beta-lactamase class C family)
MRAVLTACASVLLLGCSTDPEVPPRDDTFDPFDAEVDAFLSEVGLDGATAVIVHEDDGVLHTAGYGAFGVDRVSAIASSSKIISAGVLLRLADDGLLDLDTPISEYLGDWGDHKTDITVAQMLSNSSGMPGLGRADYEPYVCQFTGGNLTACGEELYTADDEADRVPPDSQFIYGGAQWQLAGAVAEVVSGKSWATLIDEIYGAPCGLTATGYGNGAVRAFLMAGPDGDPFAYPSWMDGTVESIDPTDNPLIEGGGYTTAADYGLLLLMHLRGGLCGDNRVLSEAAVSRMQEDRIAAAYDGQTGVETAQGYGMGWWINRDEPFVSDGGAYGSFPWLDLGRGYGAMFIIEDTNANGIEALTRLEPVLAEIFDAR